MPVTVASASADLCNPNGRSVVYVGGYFYVFYRRLSDGYLCYRSSSDGVNWGSEVALWALGASDAYAVFTDGTYIYVAYGTPTYSTSSNTSSSAYTVRGTPSNGTISWGSQILVRQAGGYWQFSWAKTANRFYLALRAYYTTTAYYHVYVYYNSDGNSSWTQILDSTTMTDGGYACGICICNWPQYADGVILVTAKYSASALSYKTYDGSSWSADSTFGSKTGSAYLYHITIAAYGGEVHFANVPSNSGGAIYYYRFTTSWSGTTTVDSSTCLTPCLAATSKKLYLFYVVGSNVLYRTMDYSTHTWSSATTFASNETSPTLTQAQRYPVEKMGVVWRTGSSSPYNVRFDYILLAYSQTLAESVSLADSMLRSTSIVRVESLSLSDVFSRTLTAYRTLAEALSLSDVVSRSASKAIVNTLSLADSVSRSTTRGLAEALSLYDPSVLKAVRRVKVLLDYAFGDFDHVIARGKMLAFSDAGRGADALVRVASFHVSPVDVAKSYDYLKRGVLRRLADSAKGLDYMWKAAVKRLVDISVVYDFVSRGSVKRFAEAAVSADYLRRVSAKVLADAGKWYDRYSKTAYFVRRLFDAGEAFDYYGVTSLFVRGFSDAGKGADYVSRGIVKAYADTGKGVDVYGRVVHFFRALVDEGVPYDYVGKGVLRAFVDYAVGEHFPAILRGKTFVDSVKGLDYVRRVDVKVLVDSGRGAERLSRASAKVYADVGKSADRLARASIKALLDAGKGVDVIAKVASFHVSPVDVVESYDYIKRAVLKPMFDASKGYDYMSKGVLMAYADVVFPDYWVGRGFEVYRVDAVKGLDYVSTGVLRAFSEVFRGFDYSSRLVRRVFYDYCKGLDFFSKGVFKQFEFEGVPYGYVGLGYGKIVSDYAVASERLSTALAKSFVDFVIARDAPYRVVSLVFRDAVFGDYDSFKGVGKRVVEAPVAVSDVMFKGLGKVFADSVKGLEVVRRGFGKTLADFIAHELWTSRGVSLRGVDVSAMADVITKVAYTLAGYNVRRVYALPREWADIIEAEDHNRRVLASRVLLDAIKRLKGELEQL